MRCSGSIALAVSPASHAQRITGTVVGTVKDDTGAVLPGVTVSIAGEKIVGTQTTVTNTEGFYRFIALPPGSYDVSYAITGFATLKRLGLKVSVGATEEISVALRVSQRSEEITVTEQAAVVDTQTNQVSANYDKDWVRNAPVPRFSFFDLVFQAPGVSQSSSGASTATSFGSGVDENSYQIDGTNLTSSFIGAAWPYPNTDAIEEIEVLSLGAPAEYGNLAGAVFNVVTRQGSNEFHGDLPVPSRKVQRLHGPALRTDPEGQVVVLRLLPVPEERVLAGRLGPRVPHDRKEPSGVWEAELAGEPETQAGFQLP